MLKPNEGNLDRLARIILGVVLLVVAILGLVGMVQIIFFVVGMVLLITGLMGFCALYKILGISTTDKK
jgi:hypothetical protein